MPFKSKAPEIDEKIEATMDIIALQNRLAESQRREGLLQEKLRGEHLLQNELVALCVAALQKSNQAQEQAKQAKKECSCLRNYNFHGNVEYKESA